MLLASVIIPVYNVEDDLLRYLDSLGSQSLKGIENILIDDRSEDSCGEICDCYATDDARIRVRHKQNRGGCPKTSL